MVALFFSPQCCPKRIFLKIFLNSLWRFRQWRRVNKVHVCLVTVETTTFFSDRLKQACTWVLNMYLAFKIVGFSMIVKGKGVTGYRIITCVCHFNFFSLATPYLRSFSWNEWLFAVWKSDFLANIFCTLNLWHLWLLYYRIWTWTWTYS